MTLKSMFETVKLLLFECVFTIEFEPINKFDVVFEVHMSISFDNVIDNVPDLIHFALQPDTNSAVSADILPTVDKSM